MRVFPKPISTLVPVLYRLNGFLRHTVRLTRANGTVFDNESPSTYLCPDLSNFRWSKSANQSKRGPNCEDAFAQEINSGANLEHNQKERWSKSANQSKSGPNCEEAFAQEINSGANLEL